MNTLTPSVISRIAVAMLSLAASYVLGTLATSGVRWWAGVPVMLTGTAISVWSVVKSSDRLPFMVVIVWVSLCMGYPVYLLTWLV
jgi:hypothetical protein